MTSSLLELLVAAKNKATSKQAYIHASKVTSSLLELLVAAKKINSIYLPECTHKISSSKNKLEFFNQIQPGVLWVFKV